MINGEYLFSSKDLGGLIRAYPQEIQKEVDGWARNKVLGASESDLVAYLVDKYSLDAPRLIPSQMHIESEGESKIDVSGRPDYGQFREDGPHYVDGAYLVVGIPFEGDADLFEFRASRFSSMPPSAFLRNDNILISFRDAKLNPEQTRQGIDNTVSNIQQHLEWIRADCDSWNGSVQGVAERSVRNRKERLLQQANLVGALGIPMRRRPDSAIGVSIPMKRKKRPVVLVPPTPKDAFEPEPEVPEQEYDFILSVIDRLGISIERSPSTFMNMGEEQIRDLILVNLNGHYEGGATGETFNAEGKTDILIHADGRNAFIAECKFWSGPESLLKAIDQVQNYFTWRDTKAALLIFSKNVDFTNVLSGISSTVPEHSKFKRRICKVSETHTRYLFHQKGDSERELYLAVQAFSIPRAEGSGPGNVVG